MTNFQRLLEETRTLVKESLANKDGRPGYMLEKQLVSILVELDKMEGENHVVRKKMNAGCERMTSLHLGDYVYLAKCADDKEEEKLYLWRPAMRSQ